jgi:anti-sigma28 factor (negative regulator of flagellin synthesis)
MRIDPKTTVTPVEMKTVKAVSSPVSEGSDKDPAAVVSLSRAGAAAAEVKSTDASEKVARLRAMIEKGDYHVDLDLLATRIVEDDLAGGMR